MVYWIADQGVMAAVSALMDLNVKKTSSLGYLCKIKLSNQIKQRKNGFCD